MSTGKLKGSAGRRNTPIGTEALIWYGPAVFEESPMNDRPREAVQAEIPAPRRSEGPSRSPPPPPSFQAGSGP